MEVDTIGINISLKKKNYKNKLFTIKSINIVHSKLRYFGNITLSNGFF